MPGAEGNIMEGKPAGVLATLGKRMVVSGYADRARCLPREQNKTVL